jgi:hypothetical protein
MSKLYTDEEIQKYFDGDYDIGHRAEVYKQWRREWQDRVITIPGTSLRSFWKFIKDNNISRTDWTRQNISNDSVKIYFRYNEDYLAATLTFI